jgi:Flp pilus assembly pilin Flp
MMRLNSKIRWTELKKRAAALSVLVHARIVTHQGGQDLIEYALMAATIAVATAAIFPQTIAPNICAIFSKVNSSLGASNQ